MIGIIIQARMGSTRLPGKILMDFCGKSLLEHILFRLKAVRSDTKTVIATSTLPWDDVVEAFCKSHKINCFRGDEKNVLKRYYDCAARYGFDQIVRMTGDNPLPDIEELNRLIEYHLRSGNDYSECHSVLPAGAGMEIFTWDALARSMKDAFAPDHLEHVNEYILQNKTLFQTGTLSVPAEKNRPDVSLTVDTPEDYERVCRVIQQGGGAVTTQEAIALCSV